VEADHQQDRRALIMAYWLMKSEPDVFSYDDLANKTTLEEWHGVRNYAARNNMKAMVPGEKFFFYHSNIGKAVVGIGRIVNPAHPDSTAELKNGKVVWECVDVEAVEAFKRPVSIDDIKTVEGLEKMILINNSRLSVQPVTEAEWKIVCKLGGVKP
jgi:predicted RNA-binding protein with PUA-like domain